MLPETLKRWLLEVVFERVLDDGSRYWKRVFTEKTTWSRDDAYGLLFGITADPETLKWEKNSIYGGKPSITGGEVRPVALVPPRLVFWDCLFSALVLFHPECWADGRAVVESVHEMAVKAQWAWPKQYFNLDGSVVEWMDYIRQGREKLGFLDAPLVATVRMAAWMNWLGQQQPFKLDEIERRPPKNQGLGEMSKWFQVRSQKKDENEKKMQFLFDVTNTYSTAFEKLVEECQDWSWELGAEWAK